MKIGIGDRMKWLVLSICIIMAVCWPALVIGMNPTLTVIGEGRISVPADITVISISVKSSLENTTDAQASVQDKMERAINALKAAGVKDDEIVPGQSDGVTSFQSTSRVCRKENNSTICDNSSLKASSIERSAIIRLKGIEKTRINQVLETARSSGANADIAGYGLIDASQANSDARKKAVDNARKNAEAMAKAEGVGLGNVLDISDYGYPEALYENSLDSSQSGMVSVTSYVVATYEIKY